MKLTSLLLFTLSILTCQAELNLTETLVDQSGQALREILVHATPLEGNDAEPVDVRADDEGTFSFSLPDGEWFIEVDQRELLARGYFCVPGSCLSPSCIPRLIAAVPLAPKLSITHSTNNTPSIVANFDWLDDVDPFIYRQFRIERSSDLINWTPLSNILLADPPIRLVDPEATGETHFYYRAVPEADFQVKPLIFTNITQIPGF